jgi:hypothetical protein
MSTAWITQGLTNVLVAGFTVKIANFQGILVTNPRSDTMDLHLGPGTDGCTKVSGPEYSGHF